MIRFRSCFRSIRKISLETIEFVESEHSRQRFFLNPKTERQTVSNSIEIWISMTTTTTSKIFCGLFHLSSLKLVFACAFWPSIKRARTIRIEWISVRVCHWTLPFNWDMVMQNWTVAALFSHASSSLMRFVMVWMFYGVLRNNFCFRVHWMQTIESKTTTATSQANGVVKLSRLMRNYFNEAKKKKRIN